MTKISKYTKKNGETAYMYKVYLGIDPATKKQKHTTRRGFRTQKEARKSLNEIQNVISKGLDQQTQNLKYKDVFSMWFENYKRTVKESTWVKTEEIYNNHLKPAFGEYYIDKITIKHCQDKINKWFEIAPHTCRKINSYNKKIFDYAITIDAAEKNPAKNTTIPVNKNNFKEKSINFYDKDELKVFLDTTKQIRNPQMQIFFRLLAFTGMRKQEALALEWKDIDFSKGTLSINKALAVGQNRRLLVQTPKTPKSKRIISLDKVTTEELKKWKRLQKEHFLIRGINISNKQNLIFSNNEYELLHPTKTRKWLLRIYKENPSLKEISTHGFRHTHCSLLFEAGASIQDVQDRLGHTDIKTTMNIYTHVTKHQQEKTAEIFSNYVNF